MRCGDRDVLLETDLGVRRGFARIADPAAADPPRRGLEALALLRRPAPLEPRMTAYTTVDSPIGEILLTAEDGALTRLYMSPFHLDTAWEHDPEALAEPARQLAEYFAGERTEFELELRPAGTRLPAQRLGPPARHPVRRDDDLRRARARARRPAQGPRRRARQRPQPDLDRRAVPPRDRLRRLARPATAAGSSASASCSSSRRRSLQASVQRSGERRSRPPRRRRTRRAQARRHRSSSSTAGSRSSS